METTATLQNSLELGQNVSERTTTWNSSIMKNVSTSVPLLFYGTAAITNQQHIIINAVYIFVAIIGIISSTVALVVVCIHKPIRSRLANQYMINQIFSDFAVCSLLIPTVVPNYGYADELVCLIWESRVFFLTLYMVSVYSMLALAVERYISVVHPVKHRLNATKKQVITSIAIVWLISVIDKFLQLLLTSGPVAGVCEISVFYPSLAASKTAGLINCFIDFIFPIFVVLFCYARMLHRLRAKVQPQAQATAVTAAAAAASGLSRARKNIIITLFVVVSFFIGCNTLKQVLLIVKFLGIATVNPNSLIFNIAQILSVVNSSVEPILYLMLHKDFKAGFRKLFRLKDADYLEDNEASVNPSIQQITSEKY